MTIPRRAHRTALAGRPGEDDLPLRVRRALVAAVLCLAAARPSVSTAQGLPATPLTLFDGRLVVSGSLSASVGPSDDRAYFNLTSYDASLLRMVQVALDSSLRLGERTRLVMSVHGQTPVDAWRWNGYPSSLYLSVQPFGRHSLALRGGIVPPAFGAFLNRAYGTDNPLIGYPLAYHYATSVRPDAFPASAEDLLRRRGFGAVSRYALGDPYREPGLPLVNPFGWNPGIGVTAGRAPLNVSLAITRGGIASGRHSGANTGWEVSARVEARPRPGLVLGVSGAHGTYIDRDVSPLVQTAAFNRTPRETAGGLDAEWSWGYWLVRAEAVFSRRMVPAFAPSYLADPLWATWIGGETRYKLFPGMYLAARLERLSFSTLDAASVIDTWDANVTRVEAGGGYAVARNVTLKLSYQRNWRDSEWYPRQQLVSGQVVLWF